MKLLRNPVNFRRIAHGMRPCVRLSDVYILKFRKISAFRLTLRQSRLNEAGLRSPSIHPSVRPYVRTYVRPSTKSFFDFNEIWHVRR